MGFIYAGALESNLQMLTQMKIAIFTNSFPKISETFISRKVQYFSERGHEIRIFCNHVDKDLFEKMFSNARGVSLCILSRENMMLHFAKQPQKIFKIQKKVQPFSRALYEEYIFSKIMVFNPDIASFEFSSIALYYQAVIHRLKVPVIVSCRGSAEKVELLQYPERQEMYKKLFTKVTRIHCVSEDMKRTILPYCEDDSKIFVGYSAIDSNFFSGKQQQKNNNNRAFKILSVGRMVFAKGFANGLLVMKILKDHGLQFTWTIVGTAANEAELLFKRDQLGLNDQVIIAGPLNNTDVKKEMENTDLFYLPSIYEGLANVVLEAMSMALPIVATRCGGIPEAIDDEVEGLLADVYDFSAQAQCIMKIAADRKWASKLGDNARKKVLEIFSLDKQMQHLLSIYQEMIHDKKSTHT